MEQPRYYYSVASGSTGNCGLYVSAGVSVLIDLGVSLRKLTAALRRVDLTPDGLNAVLLTHDHIDHVRGLEQFAKKYEVPIYASQETARALWQKNDALGARLRTFDGDDRFTVGRVDVQSFYTPHDAPGSVGFILEDAVGRFGFATDLGFVPSDVREMLCGCDAVVLESNHDPNMLQAGPYPWPLKQRISGAQGHLSNPDCAVCAAELVKSGTKTLILAHLSEKNNMPELALQQTRIALQALPPCQIIVAPRDPMESPVLLGGEAQCSLFG